MKKIASFILAYGVLCTVIMVQRGDSVRAEFKQHPGSFANYEACVAHYRNQRDVKLRECHGEDACENAAYDKFIENKSKVCEAYRRLGIGGSSVFEEPRAPQSVDPIWPNQ